jgi:hypothetical protein
MLSAQVSQSGSRGGADGRCWSGWQRPDGADREGARLSPRTPDTELGTGRAQDESLCRGWTVFILGPGCIRTGPLRLRC